MEGRSSEKFAHASTENVCSFKRNEKWSIAKLVLFFGLTSLVIITLLLNSFARENSRMNFHLPSFGCADNGDKGNAGFFEKGEPNFMKALNLSDRYLYYPVSGDLCKGQSHFSWSMSCALAEAILLNRTFLFNMERCVSGIHNGGATLYRNISLYFDIDRTADEYGFKYTKMREFLQAQSYWNAMHLFFQITPRVVSKWEATESLLNDSSFLLQRDFNEQDYYYNLCEQSYNQQALSNRAYLHTASPLVGIAMRICEDMNWDFDVVHIRRGDKLDPSKWPHLDNDTSPISLLEKLPRFIKSGRTVYIATNEKSPGFFDPLNEMYRVHMLSDYSTLWQKGSEWYNESIKIIGEENAHNLSFDAYMEGSVDYFIIGYGNVTVETFNDLTDDNKHGQ